MSTLRIGIVGLGGNTRLRHIPGLRACRDVEIAAVCNRRSESTRAAADEYSIGQTFARWQDLVADDDLDAVLIGTWPYLHCEITLAALAAGKHVLTEARMARDASEARRMLAASREHPDLVCQIVPSPFGLKVDQTVRDLLADGFIGELREAVALGVNDAVADPHTPLHWRQSAELSGRNMLALGILHETMTRWVADPVRVVARTHTFTRQRPDPETGEMREVETPDSVHVMTEIPDGAAGIYHFSGAVHHGPGLQLHLYGSAGTLKYQFGPNERLLGADYGQDELKEVTIPDEKAGGWRVEEEFINAIRGEEEIKFTDFATGVRYMAFTDAVALSAESGSAVDIARVDRS